jgi:glutathione S-transferase
MKLYYHPLSSYSQKTLMAFHEKGCAFEPVLVNLMDEQAKSEYKKIYPMGKVPFLRIEEKSWNVPESSIIIEYIERHYPGGTKLIPMIPIWRGRCACAIASLTST